MQSISDLNKIYNCYNKLKKCQKLERIGAYVLEADTLIFPSDYNKKKKKFLYKLITIILLIINIVEIITEFQLNSISISIIQLFEFKY